MAKLGKLSVSFPALLWRLLLLLGLLACIGLSAMLWFNGTRETNAAYESGRRLLITLADGTVTGHPIITTLATPPAEEKTPAAAEPQSATPVTETPTTKNEPPVDMPATITDVSEPASESPVADSADDEATNVVANIDTPMKPSATPPPDTNPSLQEKSTFGAVPTIGQNGSQPWRAYAKPYDRPKGKAMIAIIVTGLGENKGATEAALRLPEMIDLSFSPYSHEIASWGSASRITGHETLLDLPLQPDDYPVSDPGPYGLLLSKAPEQNEASLQWLMSRLPAYIGFITPQNESFSADSAAVKLLLQDFANHGLMLVLSHQSAASGVQDILHTTKTPNITADTKIDEDPAPSAIQARLISLEEIAKKRGYAVGIAGSLPLSVNQLEEWSKTLETKGIVLAPVSAVVRLRFS